jgi:SAM-dependent methyltransferase
MLQAFLRDNAIRSVLDVGCGDWQFSRLIDWSDIDYRDFEVVPAVIEANRAAFARPCIRFDLLDDHAGVQEADLVLRKDVQQHLPLEDVAAYLDLFATRFRHALVTNDIQPVDWVNAQVGRGGGRAIRLDLPAVMMDTCRAIRAGRWRRRSEEMCGSTAWRITAPLRRVAELLCSGSAGARRPWPRLNS